MASEFAETYDLTGKDANAVETGDRVPPGYYHCFVKEVDRNDDEQLILEFEVATGPHAGETITEKLSHPNKMPSKDAQKVSMNRRLLFAKRLGLIPDTAYGKQHTIDWWDAVDKEVFLKVETRTYKKKDGSEGKATGISFDGIFPLNDPRVPNEARSEGGAAGGAGAVPSPDGSGSGSGGATVTATAPATTRPATKRKDFGDL